MATVDCSCCAIVVESEQKSLVDDVVTGSHGKSSLSKKEPPQSDLVKLTGQRRHMKVQRITLDWPQLLPFCLGLKMSVQFFMTPLFISTWLCFHCVPNLALCFINLFIHYIIFVSYLIFYIRLISEFLYSNETAQPWKITSQISSEVALEDHSLLAVVVAVPRHTDKKRKEKKCLFSVCLSFEVINACQQIQLAIYRE